MTRPTKGCQHVGSRACRCRCAHCLNVRSIALTKVDPTFECYGRTIQQAITENA